MVLASHAKTPFNIEITPAPTGIAKITFKVTSDPVGQLVRILNQQASAYGSTETRLTGSLQNISHSRVQVSYVVAAAFDSSGQILDVADSAGYGLGPFEPQGIGTYQVVFSHAAGATAYAVYAQASPTS
jgi:hypothetical protein